MKLCVIFTATLLLLQIFCAPTVVAKALATGNGFSCALDSEGSARCWGRNTYGQVGDASTSNRLTPVAVANVSAGSSAISAGADHACLVTRLGGVQCWGKNSSGQLGDGTTTDRSSAVDVVGLTVGVRAVNAGTNHTCAVLYDGTVRCWGGNAVGQLGSNNNQVQQSTTPLTVTSLGELTATSVATGIDFTCVLIADGSVKCWGSDNLNGQLGRIGNGSWMPGDVAGLDSAAVEITTGTSALTSLSHTCALMTGGIVSCWGSNGDGELGTAPSSSQWIPVPVNGLTSVASISAGGGHTCARLTGGDVRCWGANQYGQLGDGTKESHSTPAEVSLAGMKSMEVAAGSSHTCALMRSGFYECWGDNAHGEVGAGQGTAGVALQPVGVVGLASTIVRAAAGGAHTCALAANGGMRCWGFNYAGQLGDGSTNNSPVPVTVSGLNNVNTIATGSGHSCAGLSNGQVACWGANSGFQLGHSGPNAPLPTLVAGVDNITALALGSRQSCALSIFGNVTCWGSNMNGELGDGSGIDSATPVAVNGLTNVTAIAAGKYHACALVTDLSNNSVQCWGLNSNGQLGNGTTVKSLDPVSVDTNALGTAGITAITAGQFHTCAVVNTGVKCWGSGSSGKLGDGTGFTQLKPVSVVGLVAEAVGVAAGTAHSCALLSTGAVQCWGNNSLGQLGDGSNLNSLTPVTVSGLGGVAINIAANGSHTCAVLSTGTMKCWGNNNLGQLGDGATGSQNVPAITQDVFNDDLFRNGLQ